MSFRFYRYEGDIKVYQCVNVEVKALNKHGDEYRIPILADAVSKEDATIFPIDDWSLAGFIADWLCLSYEEVEE